MAKNNKEISSWSEGGEYFLNSKTLSDSLDKYISPNLDAALKNLEALLWDTCLEWKKQIEDYRKRVDKIITENPDYAEVIDKTAISDLNNVENVLREYNSTSIHNHLTFASNDENYVSWVDVLQVAQDDLIAYNTTPHLSGITESDIKDLSEQIEKQNKKDDNDDFWYNSTRHRKAA